MKDLGRKPQTYRAIKYVWKEDYIGKEAHELEMSAAQAACVSDILMDYSQDIERPLTDIDVQLLVTRIKKYGTCEISETRERCYLKVMVTASL